MKQWLMRAGAVVSYIVVVIALWWAAVHVFSISSLLFPDPVDVAVAAYKNFPLLAINTMITLEEALVGFALAIVVGVALAVLMVSSKTISKLVMPALVVINSTPKVVVAPILIIWLGYGILSKVGMAFSAVRISDRDQHGPRALRCRTGSARPLPSHAGARVEGNVESSSTECRAVDFQ